MKILFTTLILTCCSFLYSQDKKIDQLEILYSQEHYTKVLRKANKLLALPDYDYSGMPVFYKSLALFRLVGQEDWFPRHKNALIQAISAYDTFLEHDKANVYIKSHYFEIAELKIYLIEQEQTFRKQKLTSHAGKIKSFVDSRLKNISQYGVNVAPSKSEKIVVKPSNTKDPKEYSEKNISKSELNFREKIVAFAKKYIGVKYQWAGTSPKGFDCSGYIGYIFKNHGINVPRSAAAQKDNAKKLKLIEAFMGDLVFFKSGGKITHVGLVISKPNEELTMIHASTSKGIIITNVNQSNYWKPKLSGAGRVIS